MAQLQDLFQTHALVKILDHLTLFKDFEYTKTDIANETGISRRTLYQVWPCLEKFDLVELTKSSGKIKFFKLNEQNPIAKQLITLADEISFFEIDKMPEVEVETDAETIIMNAIQQPETQEIIEVSVTEDVVVRRNIKIKGTSSKVEEGLKMLNLGRKQVKVPSLQGSTS